MKAQQGEYAPVRGGLEGVEECVALQSARDREGRLKGGIGQG